MIKNTFAAMATMVFGLTSANSQLAITEIMSSASTNLGATVVLQNSDYWELSNYGTSPVDLSGYKWNDNAGGLIGGDSLPFNGLTIEPGESIIFFECATCTNGEPFRAWWGLSPSVRCFPFAGNGLSSTGDSVILWEPDAVDNEDFVDRIDFSEAVRGRSFVYHPETGIFSPGSLSTNGAGGAFKAVIADDEGSPGTTTGPLPLALIQQPTNAAVNPGDTAVFRVVASGLPRPKYQWQFNGTDISGARSSTLSVSNALTENVGEYRVIVSNGGDPITSSAATLTLNANPEPPQLLAAPLDQRVFIGQNTTFTAVASGVPQPTYQWRKDGVNIAGATANSYSINGAQLSDAALYSVVIRNALGSLTNEASLAVTRRPRLVVTEIMPAQSTNGPFRGHNDWWEVTNLDDFTVDLRGYRFDDNTAILAAAIAFTNTQLTIAPGESVVFVEGMTANEFRSWWGDGNLRDVQIVSYSGAGLSLSATAGDAVVLWNSGATEDFDTIATEVFSTATNGISFGFNPDTETFVGNLTGLSEVGVHGAWVAPENGDIGSPGFLRNIPEPRNLQIIKGTPGYRFTWIGNTNRNYTLQCKSDWNSTTWTDVTTVTATSPIVTAADPTGGADERRFYRVKVEP